MAVVAKSAQASPDASQALTAPQITGDLYAAETIGKLDVCRIDANGGVYRMNGGVAATSVFAGIAPKAYLAGEPVTLFGVGFRAKYSDGTLIPGALYYASATVGALEDVATVGGTRPIAQAISAYDIRVIGTY